MGSEMTLNPTGKNLNSAFNQEKEPTFSFISTNPLLELKLTMTKREHYSENHPSIHPSILYKTVRCAQALFQALGFSKGGVGGGGREDRRSCCPGAQILVEGGGCKQEIHLIRGDRCYRERPSGEGWRAGGGL